MKISTDSLNIWRGRVDSLERERDELAAALPTCKLCHDMGVVFVRTGLSFEDESPTPDRYEVCPECPHGQRAKAILAEHDAALVKPLVEARAKAEAELATEQARLDWATCVGPAVGFSRDGRGWWYHLPLEDRRGPFVECRAAIDDARSSIPKKGKGCWCSMCLYCLSNDTFLSDRLRASAREKEKG
mgnify:CR=1 FL=1